MLLLGPSLGASPVAEPAVVAAAAQVTDIRFTGVTKLPQQRLLTLLQTRIGAHFDAETFEQDLERVEAFLHERLPWPTSTRAPVSIAGVVTIPSGGPDREGDHHRREADPAGGHPPRLGGAGDV